MDATPSPCGTSTTSQRSRPWLDGPKGRPLVIDAKIVRYPSWMMLRNHAIREGADSPALV